MSSPSEPTGNGWPFSSTVTATSSPTELSTELTDVAQKSNVKLAFEDSTGCDAVVTAEEPFVHRPSR